MQLPVAFLQFGTNDAALLTVGKSPDLIIGTWNQLRHGDGFTVVINRHHGKKAAVAMANQLVADVLGNHLDADLHGGTAGVVHAGQKGDQLANLDGLEEHHLVDGQSNDIRPGVTAGAGIGDFIQVLQQGAAVHIAREIGFVRRHQNGHAQAC